MSFWLTPRSEDSWPSAYRCLASKPMALVLYISHPVTYQLYYNIYFCRASVLVAARLAGSYALPCLRYLVLGNVTVRRDTAMQSWAELQAQPSELRSQSAAIRAQYVPGRVSKENPGRKQIALETPLVPTASDQWLSSPLTDSRYVPTRYIRCQPGSLPYCLEDGDYCEAKSDCCKPQRDP